MPSGVFSRETEVIGTFKNRLTLPAHCRLQNSPQFDFKHDVSAYHYIILHRSIFFQLYRKYRTGQNREDNQEE